MKLINILSVFFASVAAVGLSPRDTYSGVATFNDYSAQGNTVCGPKTGQWGTYGAAIGDLSANLWFGDRCSGTMDDYSKCSGQGPVPSYVGPPCPTTTCGSCFQVCNAGGYGGSPVGGIGNCIKVQIIDACPSGSAWNYCKTQVPADERCGSSTNALDIDQSAYQALTGSSFGWGVPNLYINVTPSSC